MTMLVRLEGGSRDGESVEMDLFGHTIVYPDGERYRMTARGIRDLGAGNPPQHVYRFEAH
jgi:hypothetical protein